MRNDKDMWHFKTRKRFQNTPWKDAAAEKIATGIVLLQTAAARLLSRVEQRLSLRQKKAAFFLFCAVGAAYCVFLLFRAASTDNEEFSNVPDTGETRVVIPGRDSVNDISVYQYQ